MATYHIHIGGLVQGVGFRPFVCRLAKTHQLNGWVSNTNDGLHIRINAPAAAAKAFYETVTDFPPANAIITSRHIEIVFPERFEEFSIRQNSDSRKPRLLLTPDIAICDQCKKEILTPSNKRFHYPFTTCLQCGPRYSITARLPYERENTGMHPFVMCTSCQAEYNDITNRRHYSQTNSCPHCAIPMHLYSSSKNCSSSNTLEILAAVNTALHNGRIIAVKGIGGYLLLCDATNELVIGSLRTRKQRPAKPLAVLYETAEMAAGDLVLHTFEINALQSKAAPIVLCETKQTTAHNISVKAIAPGLDKIGAMLPSSPLLLLITHTFGKPLIATSGNISASPIIYKDKEALLHLFEVADYIVSYDRDILTPQDDSVLQFTQTGQQIILRRSRGLAPSYYPHPFINNSVQVMAMGAELKSAFALQEDGNVYISQYLGQQSTIESQTSFKQTLQQLDGLVKATPKQVLIDRHPHYFVSQYGKELAAAGNQSTLAIQHHKAHFGAVLAENNLLNIKEPVLGFVWDGTGYGDDGQVWGGEVFLYDKKEMDRVLHLDYFPQLLGDKMSKEPRLSALSLLQDLPGKQNIIEKHFSIREWQYYRQLVQQTAAVSSSSMGRLLDGIAAILGVCSHNSYEGQAAMQLETLAGRCANKTGDYYAVPISEDILDWHPLINGLIEDVENGVDKAAIAWKVFISLCKMIEQAAFHFNVTSMAFSGGVFQNALLVTLLREKLPAGFQLFFHRQLSPNDECISFGQLACFSLLKETSADNHQSMKEENNYHLQHSY